MLPRSVSLIVLSGLIAVLGLAFLRVVQPFLLTLLLAGVMALLLQPALRYFLVKTDGRSSWAAGLTTCAVLGCVLLPALLGILLGVSQLYDWSSDFYSSPQSRQVVTRIYDELRVNKLVHHVQPYFDPGTNPEAWEQEVTQAVQEKLPKLLESIAESSLGLAATTFGLVGTLLALTLTLSVFITALYFFLADGPALLAATQNLLPVERAHQDRLLDQFVRTTRAVVMGTFAAAVAQGLATGIGLYFAGIERVILLTVVATVMAIVPIAGTSLVWIPCALWLGFTSGSAWFYPVSIFVIYNVFVVASLDNLIKAYVLNSDVKLHPLLAFVSVLGGLQWVGVWGVFAGPVIASCLYALLKIFKEELLLYGQPPVPQPGAALPTTTVTTEVSPTAAAVAAPRPANPKATANPSKRRNKRR